jgi:peroxiredoxin Q/BCP
MRILRSLTAAAALSAVIAVSTAAQTATGAAAAQAAQAYQAAVPAPPEVGQMAPDFTLPWADSAGVRSAPVKLSDLRGKVVVVAFYPQDRTQGCTAEMTKFRDEYKTLFGENVVVLPISGDNLESHHSWAKDMKLPFALVSDVGLKIAEQYGSKASATATRAMRNTFVVGKDGKIAYRSIRFNALFEGAYTELAAEVAKARQQ